MMIFKVMRMFPNKRMHCLSWMMSEPTNFPTHETELNQFLLATNIEDEQFPGRFTIESGLSESDPLIESVGLTRNFGKMKAECNWFDVDPDKFVTKVLSRWNPEKEQVGFPII